MSTTLDEQVVELRFDNKQFERGVAESLQSIAELQESLKIEDGVQTFKLQFSAMQVIAATALSEITKSAMQVGKKINDAIFGQIKTGGYSRASKIEAAKFQLEGLGVAWKEIEEDINYGVADTAYGLDAAAVAASQLVASGVKFGETSDQMRKALRGISGVAAMTNSTYEDTARIFTTVAGNGRLMTEQLNQLSGRGLNVAATLGDQLGKTEAEIREMVTKGKIDFQTFSEAMDSAFGEHAKDANKTLTGVLSNIRSALSKIGADFYTPIIENEGPLVTMLDHIRAIANLIRTYIQPNVQEAAKIVNAVIDKISFKLSGLYTQMKYIQNGKIVTKNVLNPKLIAYLESLKELFKNVGEFVARIIYPIKEAFREMFPKKSMNDLISFNKALSSFIQSLFLSNRGMQDLKDTFKGIFSVMKLVKTVIVEVARASSPLFADVKNFGELILRITGFIGRIVTAIVEWLNKSGLLQVVIKVIGAALHTLANVIVVVASTIMNFIESFRKLEIVKDIVSALGRGLEILSNLIVGSLYFALNKLLTGLLAVTKAINNFYVNYLRDLKIADAIKVIAGSILYLASSMDDFVVDTAIGRELTKLTKKLQSIAKSIYDFVKSIDYAQLKMVAISVSVLMVAVNFSKLTKTMRGTFGRLNSILDGTFNKRTKLDKMPKLLLSLAVAVATVAASLKVLSTIRNLDYIVGNVMLLFTTLLTVQTIATIINRKVVGDNGLSRVATEMIALAMSLSVMVDAFNKLNVIDYPDMLNKLIAIGALGVEMALISSIFIPLQTSIPRAIATAIVLVSFAKILSSVAEAVNTMKAYTANDMLKVCGAMAVMVTSIAGVVAASKGIGLISGLGLLLFTKTMKAVIPDMLDLVKMVDFKKLAMKFEEFHEVIITIAAISAAFIVFTSVTGAGLMKFAAGMVLLSLDIDLIIGVIKKLNKIDIKPLYKGLKALGVITSLFAVMMFASQFTANNQLPKFGRGMLWLTLAMTLIIDVADKAGQIDSSKLLRGMLAVSAIMALYGGLMYCSQFIQAGKEINVSMGILTASIIAIGVVAGVLSTIDTKKLLTSTTSLIAAMMSFALMSKILTGLKANVKEIGNVILMTGVMASLGYALSELSKYDWKGMAASGFAISATMLAFAGATRLIDTQLIMTNPEGTVIKIGTLVVLFGILAESLEELSQYDWKGMAASGFAMSATIVAFAAATRLIDTAFTFKKDAYKNLWLLFGLFSGFAVEMVALSFFNWKSLLASGIAISATMLAFSGTVNIILGSFKNVNATVPRMKMLAVMTGCMYVVGMQMTALSMVSWKKLLGATVSMSATMVAFAVSMKMVMTLFEGRSLLQSAGFLKEMLVMIGLIVSIGISMKMLSDIPWGQMISIALAMGGSLITFALAIKSIAEVTKTMVSSAASIGLLGVLVGLVLVIAASLKVMSTIPWTKLLAATASMGLTLAALSGVFFVIGKFGIEFTGSIGAIALLAVATGMLAVVGRNLIPLTKVDFTGVVGALFLLYGAVTLINMIGQAVLFTPGFAESLIAASVGLVVLGSALQVLTKPITSFVEAIVKVNPSHIISLAGSLVTLAGAGMSMIIGGLGFAVAAKNINRLSKPLTDYAYAMKTAADAINQVSLFNIANITSQYAEFGNTLIFSVAKGLKNAMPIIIQSIKDVSEAISSMVSSGSNFDYATFFNAGLDMGRGLADGISASAAMVNASTNNLVANLFNTFRSVTGWHSPWSTMIQSGKDLVLGLRKGVDDNEHLITERLKTLGENVKGTIKDSVKTTSSEANEEIVNNTKEATEKVGEENEKLFEKYVEKYGDSEKSVKEIAKQMATDIAVGRDRGIKDYEGFVKQMDNNNRTLVESVDEASDAYRAYYKELKEKSPEAAEEFKKEFQSTTEQMAAFSGESFKAANAVKFFDASLLDVKENWEYVGEVLKETVRDVMGVNMAYEMMNDLINQYTENSDVESEIKVKMTGEKYADRMLDDLYHKANREYVINLRIKDSTKEAVWTNKYANSAYNFISDHYGKDIADAQLGNRIDYLKEIKEVENGVTDLGDAASTAGDKASGGASKATESVKTLNETLKDSIKIFDEFSASTDMTAEKLISNMYSQLNGMQSWSASLASLAAKGLNEAIVKELADDGTASYATVNALMHMSEAELDMVNRIYNSQEIASKQAADRIIANSEHIAKQEDKIAKQNSKVSSEESEKVTNKTIKDAKVAVSDTRTIYDEGTKKTAGIVESNVDKASTRINDKIVESTEEGFDSITSAAIKVNDEVVEIADESTKEVADKTVKNLGAGFEEIKDQNGKTIRTIIENEESAAKSDEQIKANMRKSVQKYLLEVLKMKDANKLTTESMALLSNEILKANPRLDTLGFSVENISDSLMQVAAKVGEFRNDIKKSIYDSIDLFSEWGVKYDKTATQVIKNMHDQMNGVAQWNAELGKMLDMGYDSNFVEMLRKKGVSAAAEVHALATASTESEIAEVNSIYAQYLTYPEQAANELVEKFNETGYFLTEGFINGMDPTAANENAMLLGNNTLASLRAALGVHSPSIYAQEIGEYTDQGLQKGLFNNAKGIYDVARIVGNTVLSKFKLFLSYDRGYSLGVNMVDGLKIGILSKASEIAEAAASVASAALSAAKAAVDSNSPAKKFIELGKNMDEGLAIGIKNYASMATYAAETLATDTMNAASDIVDIIDWDMNPVIKPVLDLSNVKANAGKINDMFKDKALNAKLEAENQNGNNSEPTQYSFVQNNYSPKSLSRKDIYRNTKNQFAQLKGLVNNA